MSYQFELVDQKVQPVISVRTRTSAANLPQTLGAGYGAIMAHLGQLKEAPLDAAFAAYYNMDMENLDIEMGFPVEKHIEGKDDIQSGEIAAGKMLTCMYKGAYSQMGPVYEAMMKWMTDNGYEHTGTCYEFYYNSPNDVPESELLTKIMLPVK